MFRELKLIHKANGTSFDSLFQGIQNNVYELLGSMNSLHFVNMRELFQRVHVHLTVDKTGTSFDFLFDISLPYVWYEYNMAIQLHASKGGIEREISAHNLLSTQKQGYSQAGIGLQDN